MQFFSEDCNKENNVFNFPGTFTCKLSDIISHGEYIGVVNCRDRAPIICVDFDNCWKGEPNTRIALVPFCVDRTVVPGSYFIFTYDLKIVNINVQLYL